MPTGYTHKVQNGEIQTLKEFALTCARAFGACVELRDDPLSSDIPDLKKSNYHQEQLKEIIKKISDVKSMSLSEIEEKAEQEFKEKENSRLNSLERIKTEKERYLKMLSKVKSWIPPTSDHENLKKFMIEQIESSIDFDCGSTEYYEKPTEKLTGEQWQLNQLESLGKDLEYHSKQEKEEISRYESRTKWIQDLVNSIEGM